ncbi:MAG: hypothetical protein M0002_14090 [Rhodospirillales bacterium]|nr:hypothetical protein [Rhodospirillales bacterium]
MARFYPPEISRKDYEDLSRQFPGAFPDAYGAWCWNHDKNNAQLQGSGHTIELVQVDTNAFLRYCSEKKIPVTAGALDQFANWFGLQGKHGT